MLSIGLVAVAALSLLTVFVSGAKLMQRSNEMAAANDVARSVLEAVKRDYAVNGVAALPAGAYVFDGKVDPADNTGPNIFPPAPYPTIRVNDTDFTIKVEGAPEGTRNRRVKVSVYWDTAEQPLRLETILHP